MGARCAHGWLGTDVSSAFPRNAVPDFTLSCHHLQMSQITTHQRERAMAACQRHWATENEISLFANRRRRLHFAFECPQSACHMANRLTAGTATLEQSLLGTESTARSPTIIYCRIPELQHRSIHSSAVQGHHDEGNEIHEYEAFSQHPPPRPPLASRCGGCRYAHSSAFSFTVYSRCLSCHH